MACEVKGCFVAMVTLMLASGFTNAECDKIGSIVRSLALCTRNIWSTGQTNVFGIIDTVCKNGSIKDVFRCVKVFLYKYCPSNADTVMWMFDLDRLEGVAEYTCSKLPVLRDNWLCIRRASMKASGKIWSCIRKAFTNYRKEVGGTYETTSSEFETTATAVCDFQAQLIKCSDDRYTQCGDDVVEVMRDVITQYMPVVCSSCSLNPLTSAVMLFALIAANLMKN